MADPTADSINVEVVYALAEQQDLINIRLPAGATLLQALEVSGLLQKHPEIDPLQGKFGIFSRIAKANAVLRDHDRVEIYRPLLADPKEVRRQRAAAGKAKQQRTDKTLAVEPPPV